MFKMASQKNKKSLTAAFIAVFLFMISHGDPTISSKSFSLFENLNQSCSNNASCNGTVSNSYCADPETPGANKTCQCLPGFISYISNDGECEGGSAGEKIESCLPVAVAPRDKCSVDLQCTSGDLGNLSHCSGGTCQCLPTATDIFEEYSFRKLGNSDRKIRNYCRLLALKMGDPCSSSYRFPEVGVAVQLRSPECKNLKHSQCISGQCACENGMMPSKEDPNICLRLASRIGESCDVEDGQCDLVDNAICDNKSKTCMCPDQTVASETRDGCVHNVDVLNGVCSVSSQCTVPHSVCDTYEAGNNKTICKCGQAFVESNDILQTCLPIRREINAQCNETTQCTAGMGSLSVCDKNQCQCKDNGILHNSQCYPMVQFGEVCKFNEQCNSSSPVITGDYTLVCAVERTSTNSTQYRCRCPSDTHGEYKGRCYERAGYGHPCKSSEECLVSSSGGDDERFVCHQGNNTCGCVEDYMANSDRTRCILEKVEKGKDCQESRQCSAHKAGRFCDFETKKCSGAERIMRVVGSFSLYITLSLIIKLIM